MESKHRHVSFSCWQYSYLGCNANKFLHTDPGNGIEVETVFDDNILKGNSSFNFSL
jgi:hypothetical protein